MWLEGYNPKKREYEDINDELIAINRFDNDDDAKIYLSKFLKQNLFFLAKLLMGIDIFPFQEILLKGMMERDFFLCVLSRGMSKSYSSAVFSVLYSIINPKHRIIILSLVFRQSRQILTQIEDFAKSKKGVLLRKCIIAKNGNILQKSQDEWKIEFVNGASITAIPLSDGQKARGKRAEVVICDEFLTFSEKLTEEVVRPFLSTSIDPALKQKISDQEDELIKKGFLKEEDRTKFSSPKFICLTSASYTFDYLYTVYQNYEKKIFNKEERDATYAIMQMAYSAGPSKYFNASFLEEAKSSMSDAQFAREMGAQFTQDSAGFYSARKLNAIKTEDIRCQIRGKKGASYLLGIDTQYAESESSDDFAMCLIELHPESRTGTVVHNYAVPGATLSNHIEYLAYLLTHFNIVYIVCDNTGGSGQFISSCNESATFQKLNLKIDPFESDFDNSDIQVGLRAAKNSYNPQANKKVHLQIFNSQWIIKSNQELQTAIDRQRIFLAGKMNENEFKNSVSNPVPLEKFIFSAKDSLDENIAQRIIDFVDRQPDLVDLIIKECTLIEVKPTANGNLSFDLPSSMRKSTSPNKARKDSYTAFLLATWGMHCFYSMSEIEEENNDTFAPIAF